MEPNEGRIREREVACDDRDAEFVRHQEQKEAEFVKRQEQLSKREAEFVKCQEQQSKREAEFVEQLSKEEERRKAASGKHKRVEARAGGLTSQRQLRQEAASRDAAVQQRDTTSGKRKREEPTRAEVVSPQRQARKEAASAARDALGRRTGALLDASQSRDILLLYFGLIESGMKENPAAKRTAELLRIGKGKVFKVNTGVPGILRARYQYRIPW